MKVLGIGFIVWLTAVSAYATRPSRTNVSQPNVFLVTIDTLRADHIHSYGYDPIQTPALDGLAKDGIRFTEAFTPSPITNISHTTILTGCCQVLTESTILLCHWLLLIRPGLNF